MALHAPSWLFIAMIVIAFLLFLAAALVMHLPLEQCPQCPHCRNLAKQKAEEQVRLQHEYYHHRNPMSGKIDRDCENENCPVNRVAEENRQRRRRGL